MAVTIKQKNKQEVYSTRNVWSGFLFGLGLVAFIDETVFHQLLHWHHFYDKSTTGIGLVSDGLFHAFSWIATVGALFMVADLRRRNAWETTRWSAGMCLGAGLFNLYDGIIQHKLMKLHQIRYNVEIIPYDIVWNVLAIMMIIAGFILLRRARRKSSPSGELTENALQ
ncbi:MULTISPECIES: DUF2243 domain-containing protein [Neobacillus]|uniref:DUF2243 domain-containing protein n=1 Tax=Neobacillus rhizophilus TaxID=2833579 RepID=A0A942U0G9_9BACI|nr:MULTISPECIES: DUF2243 domain-containing protein [Neobacillus]MBS4211010.1 DUF2243 domain-containing protein [Neobacillus rhizophilus]MBU8917440.1 DUF2243 domain-containing protein [Bacillus sp. FJAT-29953]